MNEVKLAQFYKGRKQNEVDVAYCIPDEPPETLQKKVYGGYNCLHFAVMRSNLDFATVLLDQGVDLYKQGTCDGQTPLHIAIHNRRISESTTWNLMGKLDENQLVNTLLSTQVRRNEPFNAKCKKGMTHLHIACMVNHTESVKLFVNAGEPLDQTINNDEFYLPGYTALHFAVRYSSVESIEVLLRNDANIHTKDAKGVSPLGLLIQRLVNVKDFMLMGKRAICSQWQKEIETLEAIAKLFLEIIQPNHVNFLDNTGLSTFQLACVMTDPSFTAEFLTKYSNINASVTNNSQLWPGWAPLHFAACSSVETFKLLLQHGASIEIQNARGETPLDFCMMRYNPKTICSILSAKDEISNILLSDGTTRTLDLLLAMNDCNTFSNFLQSLSDVNASVSSDSPIWPGYNALHLAVTMNEKTKIQQELQMSYTQIKSDSLPKVYNCTENDEEKYAKRIDMCLVKSCSVSAKNANGLSPVHLAFKLGKAETVNLILDHCHENVVGTNDMSILHIACAIGNENVAKQLLDRGADINGRTSGRFEWFGKPLDTLEDKKEPYVVPARPLSTPLHVAVIFENYDVARLLLTRGADAYARDALGLTPVHLSMAGSKENFARTPIVHRFLQQIPDLRESVSDDGLTHLHVAAYADDAISIQKLIQQGSNVNAVFNVTVPKFKFEEHPPCEHSFLARHAGKTPLHVAVSSVCRSATRTLLQNRADIFTRTPEGATPLQSLVDRFDLGKYFAQRLKRDEQRRVVEAIDPCGMTLLHFACATFDLKWARKLLKKGADANARMKADTLGKTPLHLLIQEASIPYEPPENLEDMVRLLLQHGADATLQDEHFSPLHQAYNVINPDPLWDNEEEENDDEQQVAAMFVIADLLLESQKSYAVNPVDYNGFSHFHYACSRGKVDIVKKFLDSGVDVDHSTDPFSSIKDAGLTSLRIAFKNKREAVARLLIECGANVTAEDVSGNTPLHVALSNGVVDFEIVRLMLSKGADINATNMYSLQKPIDCFLSSSNITYDKLKFLLDSGSTIDISNTRPRNTTIGLIVKNAEPRERQIIFQELVKICNLENAFKDGFNAIESIVAVKQGGELTFDYYLEKIQVFMKMGYELDQQNEEGKTALHAAAFCYNSEAIEALLALGARMDVTDNKNEPPFTMEVSGFCNNDSEHDTRSLEILSAHAWKLKLLGLKVHKSSEEAMTAKHEEHPLEQGLQRRCEEELRKLQQTSIGEHSTMKHFLHRSTAVNEYPTMSFAYRLIVNDFFKCGDTLRRKFPEFAGLLTMQYRKALQREKLYGPGKRAVAAVLRVELPHLCSENVLRYFENDELIEFIEVAQQVTIENGSSNY